jgi:hypothetical protein
MDQEQDDYADTEDPRTGSPLVVLAVVAALAIVTAFARLPLPGWLLKTHLGPPDKTAFCFISRRFVSGPRFVAKVRGGVADVAKARRASRV